MITAAIASFAVLFIAWLLAPAEPQAPLSADVVEPEAALAEAA